MIKKGILSAILLIVFGFSIYAYIFYRDNLSGAGPALKRPPEDIAILLDPINNTNLPLNIPAGFEISIFNDDVPNARDMVIDATGTMWVSRTRDGVIASIAVGDKTANPILRDLNRPHGLAISPNDASSLYFAEQTGISSIKLNSDSGISQLARLPSGGNHNYYSIRFGPDGNLYVAMGSTCNVCNEKDGRRATIQTVHANTGELSEFARGLRNATFMAWHPVTQEMWVSEMGRDLIGDDIPPDEINIVRKGGNYGWPTCYGKNIIDTDFHKDDHVHIRPDCAEPFEVPSYIDLQAHSAPLGLGFIPATDSWPKEYWNDLLVAYHGSWNRSVPTGYKVVRIKLDEAGNSEGVEDFITGWLVTDDALGKDASRSALGRPAGILIQPDGTMYISDDHAGVIYKIRYVGSALGGPTAKSECRRTGCSGQFCSDREIISTCEFKEEYACYREATCERQGDGECGWTESPQLLECLGAAQ
jgi:glucose/arabinose dehydrogenase